jgi:isoleucyl-tRNA synthetase
VQAGVFAIVKDVFLPWYNAYRFLVQNVQRWEQTTGKPFQPSQARAWCPYHVCSLWRLLIMM